VPESATELRANVRLIPRLDIKGPRLIKGVQLEGLRPVGDPHEFARRYYDEGADELLFMDIVASLYQRNNLTEIIRRISNDIFIPITVGGGIRSVENAREILRAGADKVAVNTAAVQRPELITELARTFGSQCVVLGIEAKRVGGAARWEAYTNNGRDHTELEVVSWARRAVELGAGEILLTSVDHEGMRRGFDVELCQAVSAAVGVPVIASGGMGSIEHLTEVCRRSGVDAVAMADVLHFKRLGLADIRRGARDAGLPVREVTA
jgi:cyclase